MLKRHEVEILLKAGHPKTEVARLSGASLRSVKRIAEESPVVQVDDVAPIRDPPVQLFLSGTDLPAVQVQPPGSRFDPQDRRGCERPVVLPLAVQAGPDAVGRFP